jgi:hypothetical protein
MKRLIQSAQECLKPALLCKGRWAKPHKRAPRPFVANQSSAVKGRRQKPLDIIWRQEYKRTHWQLPSD